MPRTNGRPSASELSIAYLRLDSIKHLPGNPKEHDIGGLIESYRQFGVIDPIGLNESTGHDFDGNGRLIALRAMMAEDSSKLPRGIKRDASGMWLVPTVAGIVLSKRDEQRAGLALNRIHDLGGYDDARLAIVLSDLAAAKALEGTGYDGDDLDVLLRQLGQSGDSAPDPGAEQERASELKHKYRIKAGQLWTMGQHRLLIGDARQPADVARLMDGRRAGLAIMDPPYGMDLDTDYTQIKPKSKRHAQFQNAKGRTTNKRFQRVEGDAAPFDPAPIMAALAGVKEQFWFGADYYAERIPARLEGSWLVWDKRASESVEASSLDAMFGSAFELLWSKARHKRELIRATFAGPFGTEQQDIKARQHPTQKALAVIEWILERYSKPEAICADWFIGSGTTIIACQRLGRICYGMEIDTFAAAVAIDRVARMGLEPILEI